MSNKLLTWKQRRFEITEELREMNERTKRAARDFTATEQRHWDALSEESQKLADEIRRYEGLGNMPNAEPNKPGTERYEPRSPYSYHSRGNGGYSTASNGGGSAEDRESRALFLRAVRTGDPGAEAELRAYNDVDMIAGTPAEGGYAVPTGLVRNIMAKRDELSLASILNVSRVPGKGTTVNWPIDDEADVVFAAVSEAGDVLQDSPNLSTKAFTLVKYGKHVTLSWELLRDEDAALEAFINNWTARGWAGTLNSLLVTEVLANGTAGLTLDAADAIGAAEIPEFVGKLSPSYQPGAQWLMHPTTFSYLQGLTSSNQFLFAPTPGGDPMGKLWGFPVNQSEYMTAYAASVKSLVFGNWEYMGFREVMPLTVLRDPYSAASSGQVKLWFWFDAVFGVLQSEALQYATHSSA